MSEKVTKAKRLFSEELDIISLLKTIWNGRKLIIKITIICGVLGLAFPFLQSNTYTASTSFVPQLNKSKGDLSNISSIAAIAGINLSDVNGGEIVSPLIFPRIIQSNSFLLELINSDYNYPESDKPISLLEYYSYYKKTSILSYITKYTLGLPGIIIKSLKGNKTEIATPTNDNIIRITSDLQDIIKVLNKDLTLEIIKKEGFFILTFEIDDPYMAAQVVEKAQYLLQNYVTKFKIESALQQLDFIQTRLSEKRKEFEEIQADLAAFRDSNKNISSATFKTQEEQLLSKYNISFNVFSELARQVEQATIKVKEDTPILTIIDPVLLPLQKSNTSRILILIMWVFFGGALGLAIVLFKSNKALLLEQWENVSEIN